MGFSLLQKLQYVWPLTLLKHSDIRASDALVSHLPIPNATKRFVFAVRDKESQSTVYILAAQSLSKQSASDAESLIRAVKPHAVLAQVDRSAVDSTPDDLSPSLPTSFFGVLVRCFADHIGKEAYETSAGNSVLKEIFGVGFHSHVFSARTAAKEIEAEFLLLDASSRTDDSQVSGSVQRLAPSRLGSFIEPNETYKIPPFAESIYPLLSDLCSVFNGMPLLKKALISAQILLDEINKGGKVDKNTMSEVFAFRPAVETLRSALNNAGRQPVSYSDTGFTDLTVEEQSGAVLAYAIKSQSKKYKEMVAIIDASALKLVRKHWFTPLPHEVEELIKFNDGPPNPTKQRKGITGNHVAAVGAGAVGVSTIPKLAPFSTAVKMVSLKVPSSMKFAILQSQKALTKGAFSAEKLRAVSHSVIASVEKTSFSAMRASFYQIMRTRRVRPMHALPWTTFVGSVTTCLVLIIYGDGVEHAVVSIPAAASIARLGRGIDNLRLVSRELDSTEIEQLNNGFIVDYKN